MDNILEFLQRDEFLIISSICIIILFILFLILCFRLHSLNKKYKKFLSKLTDSENIQEDLETFMHLVDKVKNQNLEICSNINRIEKNLENCTQNVGIVRYNAFKDSGTELSFALAMLDNKKNGIVLNGIYSREMSNIYAKPVENGNSKYTLSDEEKEAIKKAMN